MKKIIALGLFALAFYGWYYATHPLGAKIKINNTIFTIEVAATPEEKSIGLGNRESMPAKHGMLFPYDHKEQFEYWMHGMLFPLDFIWIDGNTIVDITKNVAAPKENERPQIVKPNAPVDKIFEVNAGVVDKYNIQIGNRVEFIDK